MAQLVPNPQGYLEGPNKLVLQVTAARVKSWCCNDTVKKQEQTGGSNLFSLQISKSPPASHLAETNKEPAGKVEWGFRIPALASESSGE